MSEPAEPVQTLEEGDIYFFYRPKVEHHEPESLEDVQRLYFVLNPERTKRYRLAVMGRKRLPEPTGSRRYWGFVSRMARSPATIREELQPERYRTKTRGERELPAARPLGEGVYRIVRHGDHTHLAYALELPRRPGEVQEEFGLEDEASYVISIKNPAASGTGTPMLPEDQQARYPKTLQKKFAGRRFADADPPRLLDHRGAEFLLIPSSADVSDELDLKLNPERETATSADIFEDLHLKRDEHPVKPLLEGEWE